MNKPILNPQIVALFFLAAVTQIAITPHAVVAQIINASVVNFSPGGQNIVNMDDTSNGVGIDFAIFQNKDCFDFNTATQLGAFGMAQSTNSNTLRLDGFGIGIGTNPFAELHLLGGGASPFENSRLLVENVGAATQDRVLLDLRNNGPVTMHLLDTSSVSATPYLIQASTGRMSLQQNGGVRAGMIIFSDGAIRYVANSVPNVTVLPNGTMNIIGQPGGGNLNVIGPTGGAGNLFVKGNINYNGTLNGPSDRNIKENFTTIDTQEILAKVADLQITKWNYKADENDTPHLGPMAQDFAASFHLGDSDKRISMMDSDGVALAAIQGLNQLVQGKDKDIEELNKTLQSQSEMIAELYQRLERLEALVGPVEN